ncbi:Type I restriction-modification system, specificity subunit S, partial [hydrothermal vent metagenome]
SGRFKPHENKVVYQIPVSKKLLIPLKGDLLFSRANTRELVAATCIVEETANNVFLPDKLWILRTENRIATGSYIKFTLSHPEYRRRLCEQATGTSGSMLNISKSKLLNHPIVIPPIELQNNFASFWWRKTSIHKQQAEHASVMRNLLGSLTQRAFSGELTAKDTEIIEAAE